MHEVRTWAVSAVVAAGLLGLVSWRFMPVAAATWVLIGIGWLALTAAVHLLLHNRWMAALDEQLLARRQQPTRASAQGPSHATHRTAGVAVTPLRRQARTQAALVIPQLPAPSQEPRTTLPPLRPVASRSAGATRYHRPGSSSGRARTGRAAHR